MAVQSSAFFEIKCNLKKALLISMLCGVSMFAHAQSVANGNDWRGYSQGEKSSYIQGFADGQTMVIAFLAKDKMRACKPSAALDSREGCLLLKWWASLHYCPDPPKILETMNVFYNDARNLVISQSNAFLIAEAMSQGQPISDSDLAVIREGDVALDAKSRSQQQ